MATKGDRCCVLDSDGFRCDEPALSLNEYFGDTELYDPVNPDSAYWVVVPMCRRHSAAMPANSEYNSDDYRVTAKRKEKR